MSVYPDTQGYPPLREFIAQRLGERRNMSVDPDDILLTEGSGQAIHFVTEALVDPGDAVIVDDFVLRRDPMVPEEVRRRHQRGGQRRRWDAARRPRGDLRGCVRSLGHVLEWRYETQTIPQRPDGRTVGCSGLPTPISQDRGKATYCRPTGGRQRHCVRSAQRLHMASHAA